MDSIRLPLENFSQIRYEELPGGLLESLSDPRMNVRFTNLGEVSDVDGNRGTREAHVSPTACMFAEKEKRKSGNFCS